MRKILIEGNKT